MMDEWQIEVPVFESNPIVDPKKTNTFHHAFLLIKLG